MPKILRSQKSKPKTYQTRLPNVLTQEHKKILQMNNESYNKNLFKKSFWTQNYKKPLDDLFAFKNLRRLTKMSGKTVNSPLGNTSNITKKEVWHGKKNHDIEISPTLHDLYERFAEKNKNYQNRTEIINRKQYDKYGNIHEFTVEEKVSGKQRFVNNVYRLVHPKPQKLLEEILTNNKIIQSKLT